MATRPAYEVAAGTFVAFRLDGRETVCLKAERRGKEHINHFLVPLDLDDRRAARLVYVDPEQELAPVAGVSFAFEDGPSDASPRVGGADIQPGVGGADIQPEIGDVFLTPFGAMLKVLDDARSQRLHAYVDVATGQIRPRMDRHNHRLLGWTIRCI